MTADHIQINSLMIDTLDPLPGWPRLCQASVGVGRTGAYWCVPRLRTERLAVVKICLRGTGRVVVEGQEHLVTPGKVMIMRTGADTLEYGLHEGDPPWHTAYAEIAGDLALEALGQLIRRHGHVYEPAATDLVEILTHLADRPGDHHVVWDVSASARAASTILASVAHARTPPEDRLARRAIALFEQRLTTSGTLEDAAADLGVSREQLSRAFREALGIPPATWLRQRRLELARQLLMAPDALVQDVAARIGYRSVSQFLRAFTARYGHTPGTVRRA
jgi:AraC-like DNA-binding protein